jgi:hypothetical protein
VIRVLLSIKRQHRRGAASVWHMRPPIG